VPRASFSNALRHFTREVPPKNVAGEAMCVLLKLRNPTRFDKFLEDLDDAPQIKTQLLSAMVGSVKALLNVVRGKSKSEATTLLHDSYGFPLADASALVGLLAAYQGGNI
jgi:hypothetical protein